MEIEEAIRSRSSVKKFTETPVARALIEKCLDLATWAPNHHMTEPWRFRVVSGQERNRLAEMIIEQEFGMLADNPSGSQAEHIRNRLMSAPSLVVVYSMHGENATMTRENFAATAAAVQNLLLAAQQLGLGTIWRTAAYFDRPPVKEFLQAPAASDFVAAVYIGYAIQKESFRQRTSYQDMTIWR